MEKSGIGIRRRGNQANYEREQSEEKGRGREEEFWSSETGRGFLPFHPVHF